VVFVFAIGLYLTTIARAGQVYSFGHVADTTIRSAPAINNNGQVAFVEGTAVHPPGIVETWNGGPLTVIGNGMGSVYGVSINDSGQVAFRNSPSPGVENAVEGSGGPLTIIGSDIGTLPVIDNSGTVTFSNGTFNFFGNGFATFGIFSGNGGALTTILQTTATSATQYGGEYDGFAVSHNGIVAYEQFPSSSANNGQSVFTYQLGVRKLIATLTTNPEAGVESLAVNNAGMVALNGSLDFNEGGIFLGNGMTFTQAIVSNTTFSVVGPASINDLNQLAFQANYLPTGSTFDGIYTGQDPITSKVIQTGDALGGSTVTALTIGNEALSNNGQIVFWAQLANGTSGIYTATPVPEPSSAALLLLAISSVPFVRRPKGSGRRVG